MLTESKTPDKFAETPRDKPQSDRVEHGNLERRPGAQAHPRFGGAGWARYVDRDTRWHWH